MFQQRPDSETFINNLREPGGLAIEFVRLIPFLQRRIQFTLDRRLAPRLSPDDIVQETFLIAQRRLDEFLQTSPMPFNNWVALLAKQETVTAQRRHLASKKRSVLLEQHLKHDALFCLPDLQSPTDVFAEYNDRRELLSTLLARLSPIDRRVLVLRDLEQHSNSDVAVRLGITRLAARKRYSRALQRLRDMVKDADMY